MSENNEKQNNNKSKKKREFILTEDVKSSTVKDIIMGIVEINRHDSEKQSEDPNYVREPIKLIVNTFGGSVYDGFALVGVIDTSETPVHTYLYGKAMSMGFLIFASGHKRFMHPLGTLMYHQIILGTHDTIKGVEEDLEQSKNLMRMYDNYILMVSNVPKEKMDEAKQYKYDWHIGAYEAEGYGLVDELLVPNRFK